MDRQKHNAQANQPSKNGVVKANPSSTPAAKFNIKVLRTLQNKLKNNPEVDIASLLTPSKYSNRLESFKMFKSQGKNTLLTQMDHCQYELY